MQRKRTSPARKARTGTTRKKKSTVRASSSKKQVAKRTTVKKKTQRVQTGIPHFDQIIGGGFGRNTTNLIIGNSGSGKSIFAIYFLLGGMKKGEKCLYVTFEERKSHFYKNMRTLGIDLESYEKKGLFTFLEYSPIKVKTMLEEGGGAIENTILSKKISRMVIDSITSFELLFEKELEKREAALSLFGMISNWQCTSLLTLQGDPAKQGKSASRTLEFESDAIINLYYTRKKREREHYFEVLKMRGTDHSTKLYNFDITEKGIAISKKPVSGV